MLVCPQELGYMGQENGSESGAMQHHLGVCALSIQL